MASAKRDKVIIQRGILSQASGSVADIIVQENGVIRIKPEEDNK